MYIYRDIDIDTYPCPPYDNTHVTSASNVASAYFGVQSCAPDDSVHAAMAYFAG